MQTMTAMDRTTWEHILQIGTDTDINNAAREIKQYEMKVQGWSQWVYQRSTLYIDNKVKAYALLGSDLHN